MIRMLAVLILLVDVVGCGEHVQVRSGPVQYPDVCGSHVECFNKALEALAQAKAQLTAERQALQGSLTPVTADIAALKTRIDSTDARITEVRQFAQANGVATMEFRNSDPGGAELRNRGFICVRLDDSSTPSLSDDYICFKRP